MDVFTFRNSLEERPCTRRGILSAVNSLYDPLGFLAPMTITGKLLLREISHETSDWDEQVCAESCRKWKEWKSSLDNLACFQVPRPYFLEPLKNAESFEVHIYSDASDKAIAAVAYLKANMCNGKSEVAFLLGKARVAPLHGHTTPRLELCAALLAAELGEIILDNLDISPLGVKYYTDSKVVLGYICNQTRRFYIYVSNRIEKIRKYTKPCDWHYIPTDRNPADLATRPKCLSPMDLRNSIWLKGPQELQFDYLDREQNQGYTLVEPDTDKEICPHVEIHKTKVFERNFLCERFEKYSDWKRLVIAFLKLKLLARKFRTGPDAK